MANEREGRNEHAVPERWSARQKTEAVLRLLRGEDLGEVSRELQVGSWRERASRWLVGEEGAGDDGSRGEKGNIKIQDAAPVPPEVSLSTTSAGRSTPSSCAFPKYLLASSRL